MKNRLFILSLTLILILSTLIGCVPTTTDIDIEKDGSYTSPEELAAYIHAYGSLPKNYISKSEARELGWDNSKGNLWEVTDEMSIGGDRFYNREGYLPEKEGRIYYEADVNYHGGFRGPERLVYSNDGLIFYTDDHYNTFKQLYGQGENNE